MDWSTRRVFSGGQLMLDGLDLSDGRYFEMLGIWRNSGIGSGWGGV